MDKKFSYCSNGQPEEVPAEVFKALVESDNKMRYFEHDLKVDRTVHRNGKAVRLPSRETSLERLIELHNPFADDSMDVQDEVEKTLMLQKLRSCLRLLDEEELELIRALYFKNQTEREFAKITGVYHNAIHKRKLYILKKLRKILSFQ